MAKNPPANAGEEVGVQSLGQEISWRRAWQPNPIFLPGESHGQGSMVGCSSQGHKRIRHDLATEQHHHPFQEDKKDTLSSNFLVLGKRCRAEVGALVEDEGIT